MSWDREKALLDKKALTRDGRLVFDLKEAVLDGKNVLVGLVTVSKRPFKVNHMIPTEMHVWHIGGLGYGPNDLMDYTPHPPDKQQRKKQYV